MNGRDLGDLMRSAALELPPGADVEERVRSRGAEVRRTNRRGLIGLVVLGALALALGPGFPDRFVPEGSRQPAAQAVLPAAEPVASALLLVRYAPGAYSSVRTETAVAACAEQAELAFPGGRPVHEVTVEGTPAEVAAVRACLKRVPGARVSG